MNHSFSPSLVDVLKCAKCKHDLMAHTSMATCEACSNIGPVELHSGDMLLCAACIKLEEELQKENNTLEKQQDRVNNSVRTVMMNQVSEGILDINKMLDHARSIDQSVQVRTDLFNAATVEIQELENIINADPTITADQKDFALAKELNTRYLHFKSVIFELSEEIVNKQNHQRAIQSYLNTLANKLREEERAALKLKFIDYNPAAPSKPKIKPASKNKAYTAEIKAKVREVAAELGLPEIVVQMTCTKNNMTPEQAKVFLLNRKNELGM